MAKKLVKQAVKKAPDIYLDPAQKAAQARLKSQQKLNNLAKTQKSMIEKVESYNFKKRTKTK